MTTACNDLVLVSVDGKPAFYARIENISPDVKPGWWQVRLLVLTHPCQIFTWILDESQIDGAPFTMGGTPIVLEKVVPPAGQEEGNAVTLAERDTVSRKSKGSKVVSLLDRKKEQ